MDSHGLPPISNPTDISDDWTSLVLAIDYLLVLDNEDWSKKLAVLTREALYLLETETGEPDPLMPFGRTWWRVAVKDFADIQYIAADRSLRICLGLFERDAQLAEAPQCSDIRRWHGVLSAVWQERSEPALKAALESCLAADLDRPRRPTTPDSRSSWLTQQSRPWRADLLPPILALGTLLKERDGLLWGGWTERTFILMRNGQLLYYLRTPDSNDEVLGDLRGVIELGDAVIEERSLDEEEVAALPECSPSFLLISAAEEPEPQPFYEWPKRCATLACRGETAAQQAVWLKKMRAAIEALRVDRAKAFPTSSPSASSLRQRAHLRPPPPPSPGRSRPGSSSNSPVPPLKSAEPPLGLSSRVGRPLLLVLLNLSWLIARAAPGGMPLLLAVLIVNASALYLLCAPESRTAARPPIAALPAALLALPPAPVPPIPLLPVCQRPPAGALAGGCPAEYWQEGDATKFNVRTGPDYRHHGLKAPSKSAMYNLITVDLVQLRGKLASAASHVRLPSPPEGSADGPLAPILIVNLQMPLTAPAAFGGDDASDDPTFSFIAYFGCSASAQAEARSGAPSAAVRLMAEYCAKAPPPGQSVSGATTPYPFKIIAKLDNIEALGLPSHLARFNGKPALIRKSGVLHAGEGYLEMAVDISKFSYFARRGLYSILDRIKDFSVHAAFVLEGTADEELPERILGAGRVPFADYTRLNVFGP